jgi:2,5-diamino-6-(ribosylamino)-4(3H)-pyrimidinone 5'-phosphate reductase
MRPNVILHNALSLDGRITGFPVDLGLYYQVASSWKEDVTLAGCDTLLAAWSGSGMT